MAASLGSGGLNRVLAQDATPVTTTTIGEEQAQDGLSVEVIELFDELPGTKALKIWAPPDAGRPAWSAASDADRELVIASAFKAFVLAEYLRQAEETLDPTAAAPLAVQLVEQMQEELVLDESVFTLGSPIFNPPNLTGKVTARTALQAMIIESDDTAADMVAAARRPRAGARAHCLARSRSDPYPRQHPPVHRLRVRRPRLAEPHLGEAPAAGQRHAVSAALRAQRRDHHGQFGGRSGRPFMRAPCPERSSATTRRSSPSATCSR